MTPKPKLQTVAKLAGVSLATVSQVLRGTGRISDETRRKVQQAAKELNYVPDSRAASMRSGKNREIGLVIHHISNPFNAEVISGVSHMLDSEGYLVSVLDSRDDPVREARNLEAFIRSARGGLIWVPAAAPPKNTLDLLNTHRIPTVTFLRRAPQFKFDHVGIENSAATSIATRHLADLVHRHIAFFGGTDQEQVRSERIAGYLQILDELKLGAPIIWPSADSKLAGMNAFMALRQAHPEVTALVCNGDIVALGACHAMARLGLRPGRDVSVIGFDDIADAVVATPPLTTLGISPNHLGRRLARVLIDRINEPDMPPVNVIVPARLVLRETTGPCRSRADAGPAESASY